MSKFLCVITMCLMMQSSLFCSEFTPTKETWDYAKSMKEVSAKFKGTAGMVMHMGDSITYANQNTRWARSFKWSKKGGYSASDIEILKWSHADKDKNKLNGWHLASVDAAGGRSETAVSGIRTGQYLKGGHRGIASASDLIKRYNPQIAIVMLGTNDGLGKIAPADAAKNLEEIIKLLIANGTIPVLSTIPPCAKFDAESFNAPYRKLAEKYKIPMIDLYKDMMVLAGDKWKAQMLSGDGVHLSHKLSGDKPTKQNLANCGYLLRCYSAVQKLKEIRTKVLQ